jgi:hypothetical protein
MSEPMKGRARLLELVEIVTIGLPFCAFKLIVGLHLVATLTPAGWLLVALGLLDVGFNLVNLLTVAAQGRRRLPVCATQAAMLLTGDTARARDVGSALDTLLSFTLVATMIAASRLALLAPSELASWNLAVILNVLGAGVLRLFNALGQAPRA